MIGIIEIEQKNDRKQGAKGHHYMKAVKGKAYGRHRLFRILQIAEPQIFLVFFEIGQGNFCPCFIFFLFSGLVLT